MDARPRGNVLEKCARASCDRRACTAAFATRKAGRRGAWDTLHPTTDWKLLKTQIRKDEFEVATDRFYVNVSISGAPRDK